MHRSRPVQDSKKRLPPRDLSRWANRVAWNVLKRRTDLELSQAQLAVLSGVGVNTVLKLETGQGNITLDTLQKICRTLQLKLEDVTAMPGWALAARGEGPHSV